MTVSEQPSKFHYLEPDFSRGLYDIPEEIVDSIFQKLENLYGKDVAAGCINEFKRVIRVYHAYKTPAMLEWENHFKPESRITEKDVMLITYGDLVVDRYEKHLKTLGDISRQYLRGVFNTIHILPFFPYSSDRGFSIMDFRQVDPNLGTWDNIMEIKDDFKLMFDGVFNHISSKSFWFQEFLNGNPDFDDFFTAFPADQNIPGEKLSKLFRPRTSSVLTPYHSYYGKKLVWTTFSPDQVDLKFQNPKVLLKMLEIMLYYVRRGADFLRLDAVTYLWDELGSTGA
ncbi:MAG: alpha-amylase family glycosyl hydrolase, partial [Spirochaetota bacterium]